MDERFFIRVEGNDFRRDGINDGDTVLAYKQNAANGRKYVVCLSHGRAILCKSSNVTSSPEESNIVGVVLGLVKDIDPEHHVDVCDVYHVTSEMDISTVNTYARYCGMTYGKYVSALPEQRVSAFYNRFRMFKINKQHPDAPLVKKTKETDQ